MANVPLNNYPQNPVSAAPAGPAVLATNPIPPAKIAQPVAQTVAPAKKQSNSPWDDDLPEEVPVSKNPAIVGSLDPKATAPKADSAPLKVPENIEEKVGQKIPATNFMGGSVEPAPITPSAPAPAATGFKPTGFVKGLFGRKAAKDSAAAPVPLSEGSKVAAEPMPVSTGFKPEASSKVDKATAPPSPILKMLLIIPGLLVVFALATLLTEAGFLSIGIERIYGAIGVEQLWGGLSPSTEKALGRSALEMQSHQDFKATGKITLTIDKSIKSDIISPLVSLTLGSSLARDESIGPAQKATKTASDDFYYTGNSNSNSNSNTNNSNTSNTNSSVTVPPSNANTNLNSNSNLNSNTNSGSGSSSGSGPVEGTFDLKTSSSSNEVSIVLNDAEKSKVSLINSDNQLFLKTSGGVNYGSTDGSKWSAFNLDQLKGQSLVNDIFNLKTDSGFSVKGAREGNEKIGNVRCYRYRIDSLEVGNSLSDLGITSDMVPTLSGYVWIGVKDKLIHKMNVKIVTPVSSAIRMIELDISFADFDVKNTITKVSSSEQIAGNIGVALTGDEKRKADITNILGALSKYKTDNKSYPVSADLMKLNTTDNALAKALVPRYLVSLPADPKAADGWYYAYKSANGSKCSLSARLENQSDPAGSLVNNVLLYLKYSSD